MKLGDGVETAIHCVASLASLDGTQVMPAAALATYYGVSSSYLVKHLKLLVADNILASVPGPHGGYRLARSAHQISLLDIVLSVEGAEPAFRCKEIRKNGPCLPDGDIFPKPCGINVAMLKAEQAYRDELRKITIAALNIEHIATADPRLLKSGETYIAENIRPQPT